MRTLEPLGDRVVVSPAEARDMTTGGLHLAPSAIEKPAEGDILAIGPDVRRLAVGQRVLYPKYAGTEITLDEGAPMFLAMHEQDITGIIHGSRAVAQRPDLTMEDGSTIPDGAKRLTPGGWQRKQDGSWTSISDPAYHAGSPLVRVAGR